MKGIAGTETLARWAGRRPKTMVAIWALALVVAIVLMGRFGGALTQETTVTNNPESKQAQTLIDERLGKSTTMTEIIILRSSSMTVDDPRFRNKVAEVFGRVTALGDSVVLGGMTYYMPNGESLISKDRHTTFIPVTMPKGSESKVGSIYDAANAAVNGASMEVFFTGDASFSQDTGKLAEDTLKTGESVGILVALIVLALVFGALAAALLPMTLAIAAVIGALGLTAAVSQVMELSFFVTNMITMMGLAVGIDYSLFVVTRYREERQQGVNKEDAIAKAGGTASRAVLFSGLTVMLALCGLVIFPLSIFKSMGIGSILVVMVAVIASLTLLPAVLSLLGDKVNSIRIPFIQSRKPQLAGTGNGFWVRTSRMVTRKPVISLVVAAGLLVAAAIPYSGIQTGMSGVAGVPDSLRAKQGFNVLVKEFGYGSDQPTQVVVDGDTNSASVQTALANLKTALASDPSYVGPRVLVYPAANLSILSVNMAGDPMSSVSMDAVVRLRGSIVPKAFEGTSLQPLVTGSTAFMVDFNETTERYTPIVFGFVLGLSFLLLTLAFRSVVVPVTAIAMNLLSVGASYGLIVLVFQKGIGSKFLGFQQVNVIETWLPLFLFAVLFGLSMDYHVFLLSRIRERFMQTGDNAEAVTFGLASTGRLITGAALIMVAVFGGFALGDMTMFQQMGFGLGVAVLLDATVVRSVLVPATMKLLGKYNWYLPRWLEWMPNVGLGEGTVVAPRAEKARKEKTQLPEKELDPVLVPIRVAEVDSGRVWNSEGRRVDG